MLSAIVLAAGIGKRLKSSSPKPLVKIGGKPAIIYSLKSLDKHPYVDEIIVVLNAFNREEIIRALSRASLKKIKALCLGGLRRQDSVYNGLKAVNSQSDWVLIHDSARPFIDSEYITKVILAAKSSGASLLAVRPKATIKFSRNPGLVTETLNRDKLWEAQTPQVFKKSILLKAYKKHFRGDVTDDASLAEKIGAKVRIVEGTYSNIKITTAEDLLLAGLIVKGKRHAI